MVEAPERGGSGSERRGRAAVGGLEKGVFDLDGPASLFVFGVAALDGTLVPRIRLGFLADFGSSL